MQIGMDQRVDPIDFLFPPTATGGGVSVWLLWLVAIPLIAGIVVTILVLRSGPAGGRDTAASNRHDREPEPPPGPR